MYEVAEIATPCNCSVQGLGSADPEITPIVLEQLLEAVRTGNYQNVPRAVVEKICQEGVKQKVTDALPYVGLGVFGLVIIYLLSTK